MHSPETTEFYSTAERDLRFDLPKLRYEYRFGIFVVRHNG